ncbi:MAG: hypothetical protein LUM44_20625 [Pyrinomonadaceae bacterium]|nr:hypothetical protein [Pyrinomonadaceae bacterium]
MPCKIPVPVWAEIEIIVNTNINMTLETRFNVFTSLKLLFDYWIKDVTNRLF